MAAGNTEDALPNQVRERVFELGDQRLDEQIREQNSLWYSAGRRAAPP